MIHLPEVFIATPISCVAQETNEINKLDTSDFPEVLYQSIASFDDKPRLPALFLEGSVNCNLVTKFFTEYSKFRTIGCYHLKAAFVFGKGLVANLAGQVFTGLDLIVEKQHLSSALWKSPLIETSENCYVMKPGYETRVIDESAILLVKAADHIYGHWLVDILPRIEVAERCGFKNLRYIISINTPNYAIEFLRLLNISENRIIYIDENKENIYCKNLIVPSVCRFRGTMSDVALGIYDKIINSALTEMKIDILNIKTNRCIYLSRKKWGNFSRRLVNSHEIENLLQKHGFEIVFPEDLTIPEQVLLFQEACCIVGEGGSALHNTVFGKAGCCIAVLQGNNNGNFLQSALGDMKKQKTGYLFGDSFLRPGNGMTGDFILSVANLNRVIEENFSYSSIRNSNR